MGVGFGRSNCEANHFLVLFPSLHLLEKVSFSGTLAQLAGQCDLTAGVCVCVRVCACACVRVRACVCVCVWNVSKKYGLIDWLMDWLIECLVD